MQNKTKKNLAQVINTQKTHSKESKTKNYNKKKKKKKFIVHSNTNNTNSDVTTSTKVLCRAARIAESITTITLASPYISTLTTHTQCSFIAVTRAIVKRLLLFNYCPL